MTETQSTTETKFTDVLNYLRQVHDLGLERARWTRGEVNGPAIRNFIKETTFVHRYAANRPYDPLLGLILRTHTDMLAMWVRVALDERRAREQFAALVNGGINRDNVHEIEKRGCGGLPGCFDSDGTCGCGRI